MWNYSNWSLKVIFGWIKEYLSAKKPGGTIVWALIVFLAANWLGVELPDQPPWQAESQVQQFAQAEPDQICEYVVKIEGRALTTQELIVQAQEGLPGGGKVIDIDFFDVERTEKLTIGPGEDLTDEAMKRVQLHPDLPTGFIFGKWDERPKVTIINRQCRKYQDDRDDVPDTPLPEAPEGPTKQPPKDLG